MSQVNFKQHSELPKTANNKRDVQWKITLFLEANKWSTHSYLYCYNVVWRSQGMCFAAPPNRVLPLKERTLLLLLPS